MDKIETRGGKRPGCGRKSVDPDMKRVQITISVSQETKSRIKFLARKNNFRVGRTVDQVVEQLVG